MEIRFRDEHGICLGTISGDAGRGHEGTPQQQTMFSRWMAPRQPEGMGKAQKNEGGKKEERETMVCVLRPPAVKSLKSHSSS